jgi:Protein of unknown function (DUF935)
MNDTELAQFALENPEIAGFVKLPEQRPSLMQRLGLRAAQSPDPRRVVSGTSYTATGNLDTPAVGVELGSSRGGLVRDVVASLANRQQAIQIYEEMSNGDASVDVSLRAAKMPVMGADYFVEPASDNQDDLDVAEFVEFNLLEGTQAPFLNVLEDILRMYEYGFSVLEKVWEDREWAPKRTNANRKTYTMLRKLAPRPTPTIKEITYDNNGGPVGVTQSAVQADGKPVDKKIEIAKLIIFTNNRKGGNLEGKSILRTAYRPWYFKSNLYNIDGIQKERHGMGFPVIELPVGFKDADVEAAKELVRNIRTNEHGGAVVPPKWILKFIDVPGQPVDVMRSAEHHDGSIMLNTMVQFLLLGLEGTGGGRATSGAHEDMFLKSLRYITELVCDTVNLYCVPYIVGYNFPTTRFPKLRARNLGETKDLQQWAAAIANLFAQKAINYTPETEAWVRKILDAPLTPGEFIPATAPSQRGDVTAQNDGNLPADVSTAQGR